ncbi:MAG TPA: aldo/keto reductase [Candidatus Gemmiger faecigallinarum]|nr:aldo/keto reductase [Candidatus Gemmiger faecigallinarum]
MKKRMLGTLAVSEIGMGCMGISHAAGRAMETPDAVRLLRTAVDMGYTFFDTAKNYGFADDPHHNEKVLGEALAPVRGRVVIATKCGVSFDYAADREVPPLLYDSSRAGIRRAVEGSLRRLRTDRIDLYFQARIDPRVEPEEVADTMAELIREGKILHWGVSEVGPDYLRRAHAVCPMTAVENRYNMIDRGHEDLIPFLEAEGIGWVAHGPMFKGLLSAAFHKGAQFARDDWRSRLVNDENLDRYAPPLAFLQKLGQEKQAAPAQLALAWVLGRKPYIVPIPGMRSQARLAENAAAANIALTAAERAEIDRLVLAANP